MKNKRKKQRKINKSTKVKYGGKLMKYEKEELSLEKGIEREWIITNGIGGYSSSTVIGAKT